MFLSSSKKLSADTAFVRADLDVPLDKNGKILETFRLDVLVPTLEFLADQNIKPIIAGHIGRPEGKFDQSLSAKHLTPYFDKVLGSDNYVLLENLRFDSGENSKDLKFARGLAEKADIYVNESFAVCHRDTASISLVPKFLPVYGGLHLEKELKVLEKVLKDPIRPLVAVVGGVKKSKKETIYKLSEYFDCVLVGGGLEKTAEDPNAPNVFYPIDYIADGLDIGSSTLSEYSKRLSEAKTIVWAGPVGAFEQGHFNGSRGIAEAILGSHNYSIVGGGDTITCLNQLGFLDSFDFVSTGGGAMLDFLTKKKLPGLEVLGYYD